jgi:hypothetical protein
MDFDFFRRSSVELCTAILQPNARASAILQQYLRGLMMTVSNGLSRRRSTPASPPCRPSAGSSDAGMICGRALPLAEAVDDAKLLRSRLRLAWRPHAPPADVWSRKCFSRHFGPGPRI